MSLNPASASVTIRAQWTPVYGRGQANTSQLSFELAGAAVTPASVAYSLLSPVGTAIVDAAAATVTTGTASYALTSTHLPATADLSAGYLERWAITYDSGDPATYERTVTVGRRTMAPPIGQTDLEERYPNLARQRSGVPQIADYQTLINQAWSDIIGALVSRGTLPNKIVQPSALRNVHIHRSLQLIYENFAMAQPDRGNWLEFAKTAEDRYTAAWSAATAQMDEDDDGVPDAEGDLRTGLRQPVIYNGGGPTFIGYRYAANRGW